MSEFQSNWVTLSEQELQPHQSIQTKNNTSLHVVVSDKLHVKHDAEIFTLRDGKLPQADRNPVVPPENDARNIARIHGNLIVSADRSLILPDNPHPRTQGYSVRLATSTIHPSVADRRAGNFDTPHEHTIERHSFSNLLEYLQDQPDREIDIYYLQVFGHLALRLPL